MPAVSLGLRVGVLQRMAVAMEIRLSRASPCIRLVRRGPLERGPARERPNHTSLLGVRSAQKNDQRNVYLWSFPHTRKPGKATPSQFSKETFADAVLEAYTRTGKTWEMWVCVKEAHPLSKSELEKEWHFHLLIQLIGSCRRVEQANYLRQNFNIYASVATASSRNSYWAGAAYLLCPSAPNLNIVNRVYIATLLEEFYRYTYDTCIRSLDRLRS